VPLTTAAGTNSLYAESSPGRGDFTPFALGYGTIQRFWGAACAHHTVANETSTRVSFDFRVVPRSHFDEATAAGSCRPGAVYGEMDSEGRILLSAGSAPPVEVE
jgi:hypothetical protein